MSRLESYNLRSLVTNSRRPSRRQISHEDLESIIDEKVERRLEEYLPKQDFNRKELQIINKELKTFYDRILYFNYRITNKLNSRWLFVTIMALINTYAINGAYYYYNGVVSSTKLFFDLQNIEIESIGKKANAIARYISNQDILTKINLLLSNAESYKIIFESVSKSINIKPIFDYIVNYKDVVNILSDIWEYLKDYIFRKLSIRKNRISLIAHKYLEIIKIDIFKQIEGEKSSLNLNKIIPSSTISYNIEDIYTNNLNFEFFDKQKNELMELKIDEKTDVSDVSDETDETDETTTLLKDVKQYFTITEDKAVKFNRNMVLREVESLATIITETLPERYLNLEKSYISHEETLDDTIDICLVSGILVIVFFIFMSMLKKNLVSKIKLRINNKRRESLSSSHNIEYIEDGKKRKSLKKKSVKRKSVKRKSVKRKSVKRKSVKRKKSI
jgi:hypothetical protein